MKSDITCPVCKKESPERIGRYDMKTPKADNLNCETTYYLCRCVCGNTWEEKYQEA